MTWMALPIWVVVMTEASGAVSHYVTDEEVGAPLLGRAPRSVCGRRFPPGALVTPPGPLCPACRDTVRPLPAPRRPRPWHRRPGAGPG